MKTTFFAIRLSVKSEVSDVRLNIPKDSPLYYTPYLVFHDRILYPVVSAYECVAGHPVFGL
jgi:hypothetical protein